MPDLGLVGQLAQFGLLGIILGIMIVAYFWRDKALTECWTSRLKDLQDISKIIQEQTAVQQSATRAQEERNRAIESLAQAQQQTARTLEQLTRELTLLNARADAHRDRE